MTDFAIETSGLRKSFKGQAALAGLTFAVPKSSFALMRFRRTC